MTVLIPHVFMSGCVFVAAIAIYRTINRRSSFYSRLQGKCVVVGAVLGYSAPSLLMATRLLELGTQPPPPGVVNELVGGGALGLVVGIILGNIVGLVARQFVTALQVSDDDDE